MKLTCVQKVLVKEADVERRRAERSLIRGDISSETRLLASRVRSGELNPSNVAVAAALGHAPAKSLGLEELKLSSELRGKVNGAIKTSNLSDVDIVNFAVDCAESVLDKFESEFPSDHRPREALEAARNMHVDTAVSAAVSAAASAAATAARSYVARAAANAAYAAANAAYAAAWVARDPAAARAARAADVAASVVLSGASEQSIINLLIGYLLK